MSVRYLVLSDLHLGARESTLTHCDEQGEILHGPSDVMLDLGKAMLATLETLTKPGEQVQLVLLGDALDLGLTPFGKVSKSFLQLLETLLPNNQRRVISENIIYIPGNHDHHMWRMAQDREFVRRLADNSRNPITADIQYATPLLEQPQHVCSMLQALMQRYEHLAAGKVNVAYPNWALLSEDGIRAVVLHHGHYVDSMYRALSSLRGWLTGDERPPSKISDLESENGQWIDFLWSNLGSSGAIGTGADTLYETMLDAGASHDFAQTLAKRIMTAMHRNFGFAPDQQLKYGVKLDQVIQAAVDFTASRGAEQQRDSYAKVMMGSEITDLRWYVGGPVRHQFAERPGTKLPEDLTFIFGHTHKPFQDQIVIHPFKRPVSIFNTGGWVLDEPQLRPAQGASAILIDDTLDVVALRLFNNPVNGKMNPVHVADAGKRGSQTGDLLARVQKAVEATQPDWQVFSASVEKRIATIARQRVLRFLGMDAATLTPSKEAAQ